MEITRQSENVSIPGHRGTWYTIDETTIDGKKYFLMEHEKYGDEALHVILDHNGSLVLEDVANGFDDLREHFLSEDEEWEKHYSKTSQETKAESPPLPQRLFVDMDGTLAEFKHVDTLETLYEKGYFANLKPIHSVVEAIREIYAHHPDIEVHILSAYLSDSPYALSEKNQWLDLHLPEIATTHRVFCPCGTDKKSHVPGGIRPTDFLLDDYTQNLSQWEPPARGIKLLNGINHTKGTWQGDRIRFDSTPTDLAEKIVAVMRGQAQIYDSTPSKAEGDAFSLGVHTAQEIMGAGYQPYYNKGNLHIFQNPKTGGLQLYAVSFRKDKPGQLSFEKLDTKESLAPYKHLMSPEMQQSFSRACEPREPMEY